MLDEDADAIDYDDLLGDMQDEVVDESKVRVRDGFDPITLVGWAEPPRYDKATKKMYWAKELKFGDSEVNTLNYNVRVLGREGVLVLNAVATMDQLARVRDRMGEVTAFSNFTAGNRYEDYDPDKDNVAAYGLAALVGGALAAKTGLLAKLGALLLAGKKLIVLFFVVVGGFLSRFFNPKSAVGTAKPPRSPSFSRKFPGNGHHPLGEAGSFTYGACLALCPWRLSGSNALSRFKRKT